LQEIENEKIKIEIRKITAFKKKTIWCQP
jgi:hypothetical protein